MIKAVRRYVVLATMAWTSVYAGPPFVTDDPEPVDLHAWEINYGATWLRTMNGSGGALPGIDLNYGALPDVQLHAQPQLAYTRGTGGNAVGLGDLELGVKYRLTSPDQPRSDWMVGIYPMLELPTGSARRGLGAGAHSVYLPLWLQTTRGRWTVFGGAGYWLDHGADAHNAWAGGITALYEVDARLQLGAEVYGSTRRHIDEATATGFNLGGILQLRDGLALLFSAGHGLRNAHTSNNGTAYIGLRTSFQ
ncbi:hypothetical protein [Massilia putida]|uniref:hypothetical protein n=1 Tax=Massilia putida TaxID=1141883 RepID=UPI000952CE3E|nr:hypothetical protein [Massilia putida]